MRKLLLASFTAKTVGKNETREFDGTRLIVVNEEPGDVEGDLIHKAQRQLRLWFKKEYPASELMWFQAHPTIGEDATTESNGEVFTREALVSFGKYLLSDLRKERILSTHNTGNLTDEGRLREVYHADVENWKQENSRQ